MEELLARLRALLRRQRSELTNVLRVADLEIDMVSRRARRGERQIELTNREFGLLTFLAEASPRIVGRTAILEHVWEHYFDPGTNVVNVYIKYLRNKVDGPGEVPLVQTVRGVGFALRPGES
jgi:two-component system copper resistance phosphate regulon response regulator CusR